jgi:hypothetical protein
MAYIMVGGGSAQCVLSVTKVPKVGNTITVRTSMIVWAASSNAYFMDGCTYTITKRVNDVDTDKYGILPWFNLNEVEE